MLNVIIAEDFAPIRQHLADMIAGLENVNLIGQAADAPAALDIIQQLKPHVAILDIHMPGGSGFQVMEALTKNGDKPVIIMLTAFPYPQYRKYSLAAGAEYFFDKASEITLVGETLLSLAARQEKSNGHSGSHSTVPAGQPYE